MSIVFIRSLGSLHQIIDWICCKCWELIVFLGLECCFKLTVIFNYNLNKEKSKLDYCVYVGGLSFPLTFAMFIIRCPHRHRYLIWKFYNIILIFSFISSVISFAWIICFPLYTLCVWIKFQILSVKQWENKF